MILYTIVRFYFNTEKGSNKTVNRERDCQSSFWRCTNPAHSLFMQSLLVLSITPIFAYYWQDLPRISQMEIIFLKGKILYAFNNLERAFQCANKYRFKEMYMKIKGEIYVFNSLFRSNEKKTLHLSYQRFYLDCFCNISFPPFNSLELSQHSFNQDNLSSAYVLPVTFEDWPSVLGDVCTGRLWKLLLDKLPANYYPSKCQ